LPSLNGTHSVIWVKIAFVVGGLHVGDGGDWSILERCASSVDCVWNSGFCSVVACFAYLSGLT